MDKVDCRHVGRLKTMKFGAYLEAIQISSWLAWTMLKAHLCPIASQSLQILSWNCAVTSKASVHVAAWLSVVMCRVHYLRGAFYPGGLGSVGSLISLYVKELTDRTHLWLLGRSGRGSWDPDSADNCLVTLARSDVSLLEEADYVIQAAGSHLRLQVSSKIFNQPFISAHSMFDWVLLLKIRAICSLSCRMSFRDCFWLLLYSPQHPPWLPPELKLSTFLWSKYD